MQNTDLKITNRIYIDRAPSVVFKTLTTAEGWDAWFTTGTEIDVVEEGFISLKWKDYGVDKLTAQDGGGVVAYEPNRRFAFEWKPGETITTVSFMLEEKGSGTILSLAEEGYTSSSQDIQAFSQCAVGWGEAMLMLKLYLEQGLVLK